MQSDVQELQFKKRARRRLVGAIALVLLMITVLPMVLDDRSASLPQNEITISIPGQDDENFSSAVMPLPPEPIAPEDPLAEFEPLKLQGLSERDAELRAEANASALDAAAQAPTPEAALIEIENTATYSVQIGVFSDAGNVKQLVEKLKSTGISAVAEKIQTAQGEKIRLRAGPFASRMLAEDALADIEDAGLSGMIVTNK
jgi:DedD protein